MALVPVAFAGNVNLSLGNAVIINATELVALPAGTTSLPSLQAGTHSVGAPTIEIEAPYVAIAGLGSSTLASSIMTTASLADANLDIQAGFIDLENQFSLENFAQASFVSSGDIRLSSTYSAGAVTLQPGVLYTPGNLTFQAADIYPASGETFIPRCGRGRS